MTERQAALLPLAPEPIYFVVPGPPHRKIRPKFRIFFAQGIAVALREVILRDRDSELHATLRKFVKVSTYTEPETAVAEEAFQWAARKHRPRNLFTGPLRVDLVFVLPIPSSWPAAEKAAAVTGAKLPVGRPDRDNLEKLVLDAMKGMFYVDDSQVCAGETTKIYGVDPRTEVRITPILESDGV